jgi:hypothetical protein
MDMTLLASDRAGQGEPLLLLHGIGSSAQASSGARGDGHPRRPDQVNRGSRQGL